LQYIEINKIEEYPAILRFKICTRRNIPGIIISVESVANFFEAQTAENKKGARYKIGVLAPAASQAGGNRSLT
jgi:hypothetical protein